MAAPVGSVPVSSPNTVKPPASAKPVSSIPPSGFIKIQDAEFDAFIAFLQTLGITAIDSLSDYDKQRYREALRAMEPNGQNSDAHVGTGILLLGLEVFANQVAGAEAALDVAQINELTRGMSPNERMNFVLDMAFTVMNIKDDPNRLRAYLDQQRQVLINRRNSAGDNFTAESVRLGGFKMSPSDRRSAQDLVREVGGKQRDKNNGAIYFDLLGFLINAIPFANLLKLLKGPFRWMLKFFPKLANGLDDFARAATSSWQKSGIGKLFQKRGLDCNSFTANTKVWLAQTANDLAKKAKSTLEKTETLAKTALTAVAISSITTGTQVLAHNEQTKLESPQTVTATHEHLDPIIVTLKLETSDKKLETITTTPEHPFFALLEPNKKANGIWVNAGELENGNWLRRANGETGIVKSVAFEAKAQKMYNLTVARDHTFFVGDGQWLVHNTWCPTNRLNGDAGEYAIAKDLKDQGFEILSGPDGMGVTGKIGFNVPGVGVRYPDLILINPKTGEILIIEGKTGGAARSASQILKDIEIGKGNYTISPGGNIRDLDPKIQAQLLGGLKIPTKVATIDPLFKK